MKKEDTRTDDMFPIINQRDAFLLAEYGMLMEMRRDALNLQERRLNAFLVISGGAVAALGLAAQVKNEAVLTYQYLFPFVLGMMIFSIFLFGWITFERMILRAAEINIISKAMQSIREYYIMKNNDIEDYLLFAKLERGPRSLASQGPLAPERNLRLGLPQAIAILNSFIAAIGSAVIVREVFGGPTGYGPLVGSLVFIITMFIFNSHYRRRLDILEARASDLLGKTANY